MTLPIWPLFLAISSMQVSAAGSNLNSPEDAARQLARCGFSVIHLSPNVDEDRVLEINENGKFTDDGLKCAARVSWQLRYILIMPDAIRERYGTIYRKITREYERHIARDWLKKRGILAKLPNFVPGQDKKFAKQLEDFCGDKAQDALNSDFGPHAISPDWLTRELKSSTSSDETFTCLFQGAAAAGFDLGFIGNEAAATTN